MQDADLFLSLAEIAGVFLGFGALISIRNAGTSDAFALTPRRAVSMLLYVAMNVALVLVVLGLFPDQEPALYLTAVGLLLVLAASFLRSLAYSFGRPRPA